MSSKQEAQLHTEHSPRQASFSFFLFLQMQARFWKTSFTVQSIERVDDERDVE